MDSKSNFTFCEKSHSSRIKMENDDSLEFDEEEDSHEEDSDKDKELKETKDANGKPPYSYVAMIGKCPMSLYTQ